MINGHCLDDLFGDPLEIYLREIEYVPPISPEEERMLIDRIAAGDPDRKAKKRLVESHLGIVVDAARPFATADLHILDLIQQGNMGLMKAAETVSAGDGPFAAFATGYVHRALQDFIAAPGKKIIPPHSQ